MKRKVVRTDFVPDEYSTIEAVARKKGLRVKEALREAVLRWNQVQSPIDPIDPIFQSTARDPRGNTVKASREEDDEACG